MKLGLCCGFDKYDVAVDAGFDFVEPGAGTILNLSDSEFEQLKSKMAQTGVYARACNCLLPSDIRIACSDYSKEKVDEYANRLFKRAAQLGIKTAVLGSGGSRRIPDDEDRDECLKIFEQAVSQIAACADEYGITIALEPLRAAETNNLHYVEEAAALCDKLGIKNLKINPDVYHLYQGNEPFENLNKYSRLFDHMHICNYVTRYFPLEGDEADYNAVFDVLKRAGYEGEISIEGRSDDFDADCVKSFTLLKKFI